MDTRGQHTLSEITSQTAAWADAVQMFQSKLDSIRLAWQASSPKQVLFTGCGSTHYLSLAAAALFQGLTGVPTRGLPASEIVLFPSQTVSAPGDTLLVAVSRSGTTTETAAAMTKFRQLGGRAVWGITCYADTPVGRETDLVLLAEAAQEQSVAQTRSFSTMMVLVQGLAAAVSGVETDPLARLPSVGKHLLETTATIAEELGARSGREQFFFLGSGPQYGIACEAMLKMKEMSISHSEAYHFMEFRHGPKSLVDDQTLVAGLASTQAFKHEQAVLREMGDMGAMTLLLSPSSEERAYTHSVPLPADMPDWIMPVLYLPTLQMMAYHRSISKGLNPDSPRNLDAVVHLDPASLA